MKQSGIGRRRGTWPAIGIIGKEIQHFFFRVLLIRLQQHIGPCGKKCNTRSIVGIEYCKVGFHIGVKEMPCIFIKNFKSKMSISR